MEVKEKLKVYEKNLKRSQLVSKIFKYTVDKMDELINEIYELNLQNNNERTDFDRAFKFGIETALEELKERSLLKL